MELSPKKSVWFSSFTAENDVKCLNQSDRLTSFSGMICEEHRKNRRKKFRRIQVLVSPFLRIGFRSSRSMLCWFIVFQPVALRPYIIWGIIWEIPIRGYHNGLYALVQGWTTLDCNTPPYDDLHGKLLQSPSTLMFDPNWVTQCHSA